MSIRKAVVQGGKAVIEGLNDYADGTELEFEIVSDHDDLTEEQRARLHAALDKGWADIKAGRSVPGEVVLKKLRAL